MNNNKLSSWVSNLLMLAVAVGAAWLIWSLAAENRALKARIAEMSRPDPAESLVAGDQLPDVELAGPAGAHARAGELAAGGAVVAFLTTRCPYCEQTLPVWSDLQAELEARGVSFVGVSLDPEAPTRQYVAVHDLRWPVWTVADPEEIPDLEVHTVPYTIVVAPGGQVTDAWLGALVEDDLEAIAQAVESKIPGTVRGTAGSAQDEPRCCEAPTSSTDVGG